MESYMHLGFAGFLREALKIFSKKGKLVVSITLFNLSLYSILYFSNIMLIKQVFLLLKRPNTHHFANLLISMDKDIRFCVGLELIVVLASSIGSFIFTIATILASAITPEGNLSLKDFLLRTLISCKTSFVSLVYITLFGVGCSLLALEILFPIFLTAQQSFISLALSIVFSIVTLVNYTYLAVIWNLALIISVLEERCGVEAVGKAAQIVKHMHLLQFRLINLLSLMLSFVLLRFWLMNIKWSIVIQLVLGLLVLNSIYLVRMFMMMAYTVLYYQCNKTHGEEVELQVSMEYSKIPTIPPLDENIP